MRLWFSLIMKSQANNDTVEWRCHEIIKLKKFFFLRGYGCGMVL